MRLLVVSAHSDDYIYGTVGALMTHREDERRLIVLAPSQAEATRVVVAELGIEATLLDAPYRNISQSRDELLPRLTELISDFRPDYVLAPTIAGDWSPDHQLTGQLALEACIAGGVFGSWNARFLRYPIPATTTRFEPNFWLEVDPSLLELKGRLARRMTAGAEDIWPAGVVDWEIKSGHRFAHEVGWPTTHVEGFDALYAVPFQRFPPRDDSLESLAETHRAKFRQLMAGDDLSANVVGPSRSNAP